MLWVWRLGRDLFICEMAPLADPDNERPLVFLCSMISKRTVAGVVGLWLQWRTVAPAQV